MKAIVLTVLLTTLGCAYKPGRLAAEGAQYRPGEVENFSSLPGASTAIGRSLDERLRIRSGDGSETIVSVRVLRADDRITGAEGMQRELSLDLEVKIGGETVRVRGRKRYAGASKAPPNELLRKDAMRGLASRLIDQALLGQLPVGD